MPKIKLTSTDLNETWHKSIPDAKFECSSSSGFGDMTSQNLTLKKGTTESSNSAIYPRKRV